jgi:hypothetical protein
MTGRLFFDTTTNESFHERGFMSWARLWHLHLSTFGVQSHEPESALPIGMGFRSRLGKTLHAALTPAIIKCSTDQLDRS